MKKSEIVNVAAVIMAGMMSNPAAAGLIGQNYSWERQQLFHSLLNDIGYAVMNYGVTIEEDNP